MWTRPGWIILCFGGFTASFQVAHGLDGEQNEMHVQLMKKIDILNFITNFRKAPNDIKTHVQILAHLGADHEPAINHMLEELKQARVIKEVELQGEKAFQVVSR